VILPVSFVWRARTADDEIIGDIRAKLGDDPALDRDALKADLVRRLGGARSSDIERVFREQFQQIRQEIFLDIMLKPPRRSSRQHREAILRERPPTTGPVVIHPLDKFFNDQFDKAEAIWALWAKFPRDVVGGGREDFLLRTEAEIAPFESIARPAGGYGFVEYIADDDGILRSVPLVVNHRGRVAPQLALALACAELGVHPDVADEFELSERILTLKPPGGSARRIPLFTADQRHGRARVGASFLIPWTGGRDWTSTYGPEGATGTIRHLPLTDVSQIIEAISKRQQNRWNSLKDLNALRAGFLTVVKAPGDDYEAEIERTLGAGNADLNQVRMNAANGFAGVEAGNVEGQREMLRRAEACRVVQEQNERMTREIATARERLRGAVNDRVVIVGWAATAAAADFVPTPVHDKCPGAVVHGVVYNAIMTGNAMTMGPGWLNGLITIALGLAATWLMAQAARQEEAVRLRPARGGVWGRLARAGQLKLSPGVSSALGALVVVAWVVVNAVVLFGFRHYVLNLTSPLLAAFGVWSLGILAIAVERYRVTKLLHGYVDPQLVDYLKKNPDHALFQTKKQKVTVCFSDIEGFTTMTEELKERMIPLLQGYLYRMVSVIRRNNGVVNKFMGDGIMFVFGVPEPKGNPAESALQCVLEMQAELEAFNAENRKTMEAEEFRELKMRCGVNTGDAYCGDAGPLDAREYTALGDTTNVAARLETANKEVGTRVLVSRTTVDEVAGSLFFFRPVGTIRLRNRRDPIEILELVSRAGEATAVQREHAELLGTMIANYCQQKFEFCRSFAEQIAGDPRFSDAELFGKNVLCRVYRETCEAYAVTPPEEPFDRHIISQG
jgi:class 3 adenylate cyclase